MHIPQLSRGIPNAIIVWIKDGSKVIFIAESEVETKAENASMNTCDNCIHCEMCRWINEVERDGCDFWDGNQKEEAIEEIRQAAEGLLRFARTGITLENADEADRSLKTLANAFLHHSWNADKRQQ